MLSRLQHFFNTLTTNWSQDPAARGAAKMSAGAVLLVEGLFGVVRGGGGGTRKGGRSLGGIIGGLLGLVMGLIFLHVGSFVTLTAPEDAIETTGIIIDRAESRSSEGQPMYSPVIEFQASDGQTYQFTTGMRSSSRPTIGEEVNVVYSEANPDNAHRTDGIEVWLPWGFMGAGYFIIASSLVSLMVSVTLTVFGIILLIKGRADRRSVGASAGFFSDLISLVGKVRSGGIDVGATAAGHPGASQGGVEERSDSSAVTPESLYGQPAASPSSVPPAGWYIDPEDKDLIRWWDGTGWGSHSKPRDA